jgi:3-deoxy-7-phosphoheptulonate synthase
MIAVLTDGCALADKARVVRTIEQAGLRASLSVVGGRTWVSVVGEGAGGLQQRLQGLPGVHEVRAESPPWPLVARTRPQGTVVRVGPARIGGDEVVLVAGPCAVEGEEQVLTVARAAKEAGAGLLRGGAYKPRTSPYSFQGLGVDGLRLLALARQETGLPVVTECVDPQDLDAICEHADMVQVGARNMQNFSLLSAAGGCGKPVLLKRGMSATLDELLHAAEYVVSAGNAQVVLCLRGIRTFERTTRNTLDLGALPWLKERCHLPVMVDPSHATGVRSFVAPLARAAVAAGADAVMVEVHPDPDSAWSDGPQSLTLPELDALSRSLRPVAQAIGREMT